ncbi:MAG: prolyl oligopeptidase family serine peptidase [Gemmatimonadaceae bacterium]|nr:prolyl oligopeptidase family serine peptidase [Gemmatimonadaceae bacterium]
MALRALRPLLLVACLPPLLAAQTKRPITQDTYDLWRSILQPTLSADGRWAVYTRTPTVGDGELVARATDGTTEYRVPRGWTGRPLTSVNGTPFSAQAATVTSDSRHVLALQYPTKAASDSARVRRGRAAEAPKNRLLILALATGEVQQVDRVRGYQVARRGGRYVAYQVDVDSAGAAPGGGRGAGGRGAPAAGEGAGRDSATPPARRKDAAAPLVLRELATRSEVRLEHVTAYAIDAGEQWLAYARGGPDSLGIDGVYVRHLATGSETRLKAGTGNYRSLAFDEAGQQLAFVTDADDWKAEKPRMTLYHASLVGTRQRPGVQPATVAVAADAPGDGFRIADRGALEFVRAGGVLRFGIARTLPDSIPADSLAERAVVDLWHWRDTRPQPMQRLQAAQDRNRSFAAVWHVATRQFRRIAADSAPQVQFSEDGRVAVATTGVPYELDAIAGEDANDVIVYNTVTGAQARVATRIRGNGQLSPAARFVAFWQQGRWQAYEVATGKVRDLTGGIAGVKFDQETHDTPGEPNPWGIAGWTKDDARILVYDRYDIWELDPLGLVAPRTLTDGAGRRDGITFRLIDLDADERFVDPSKPLLLRAFDNATKYAGFYRDRVGGSAAPERIVMAPKSWGNPQRARDAERFLVTRADYREFPDLWTGPSLDALTRLSDAMPEQAEYSWGDVELVKWMNLDGVPMEGLLYKPEGFDPARRYPMITYFYEQLSDGLYNYNRPAGRNVINPVVYTSLGYLVFMPNIHYTPGYPGPSAVKAIVPGVQALIARGIADPKRLGISGQSWGGYQTAYVITQTNLFAAAVPNATVVDMYSAYGGIRWETGVERAIVNYERGQSRIGGSIWEYPERYHENSPLFFLDRVTTPVLFMANDADGAVPWYQGIEFFVAMRRLGKEAYMLNYNGDAHNPRKYANQKDVDRRMQEFFAHHLLGAATPDWMARGIPFLEKGRDQMRR